MPNPIYILQLSDWHIGNIKYPKGDNDQAKVLTPSEIEGLVEEHQKNLDQRRKILTKRVRSLLERKGRKYLDIIAITGDMTDKNGGSLNEDPPHHRAIEFIKKLKSEFYKEGYTRIFCVAGNHDTDFRATYTLLNESHQYKSNLADRKKGNYEVVDDLVERSDLRNSFSAYQRFAKDIGAHNALNPFQGYEFVKVAQGKRIFVSWFNTSWISLPEKKWKELSTNGEGLQYNGKPVILDRDGGNLSVGKAINQEIHDNFKKASHDKSSQFSLSLFHHSHMFLDWHDTYPKEKKSTTNAQEISFRQRVDKYDLVLNGHTHGRLFDAPYFIAGGGYTNESEFLKSKVGLFEVDWSRGYYIIHDILIEEQETREEDNVYKEKIQVYRHNEFIDRIQSMYSSIDLYQDLSCNNKIAEISEGSNKEVLLMDLNNIKGDKVSIDVILDKISLCKKDLIHNPHIKHQLEKELMSIYIKQQYIKK